MLLTIIGVAFIGVSITLVLKQIKPEFALFSSLATGLILFLLIIEALSGLFQEILTFIAGLGVNSELILFLIKVLGIGYITEFMVEVAEDAGQSSIAGKVSLAGKVIIAGLSLPLLFDLINMIIGLV